jgi:hypothetical protein
MAITIWEGATVVDDEDAEADEGWAAAVQMGTSLWEGRRGTPSNRRRGACCAAAGPVVVDVEKAWSARRWGLRINEVDLYVARVTKGWDGQRQAVLA